MQARALLTIGTWPRTALCAVVVGGLVVAQERPGQSPGAMAPGMIPAPSPYSARPMVRSPYSPPPALQEGYGPAEAGAATFDAPEFDAPRFDDSDFAPQGPVYPGPVAVPRMRDYSWIHIEMPPPKVVKVHDIITVIVSENSEVTSDSRFERQRNAQLRAQLRQFIRLDDDLNLRPAAKDSPTIDGQLRSQLQSNGLAKTREGIRYRIAATVVDVLPNGTLILEARKTIRTNEDLWEYALVGKIRGEDVLANNTVLSENIADLGITKTERGKVADSTKRGWFLRIYDALLPF
jgi:flagellar L-ring protein FlgH